MNCECFYIVKNGTIEAARALAKQIDDKGVDLCSVCISQVVQDFRATGDYDGFGRSFRVPVGSWLVFAQGKLHYMTPMRGGKRGFPVGIHAGNFPQYIHDVEEL